MGFYERFLNGNVPDRLELAGDWIVRGALPNLPAFRVLFQKKVFRDAGGEISGNNSFLGFLNVAPFHVERGPSVLEPELEVIKINYNQPGNPGIVRRLTDEIRQVGPEEYLGRGIYNFPVAGPRNTFWFTVSKR